MAMKRAAWPNSAANAWPRSWERPVSTTWAPSATKRRAVSAPMPLVAPVIMATRPASLDMTSGLTVEESHQRLVEFVDAFDVAEVAGALEDTEL